MIQYERIDNSEEIDFNKTNKSVEFMICHYWYFKDIGFKYQPYVCNACHDYRCYIVGINKNDAISLLNNSVLDNKGVL